MTISSRGMGVRSDSAMVATGHPLAAHAAKDMLASGGSAIDAAIAADAILGVVEPMATGIGGDLLAMLVEPDGRAISYNGTGRSPKALSLDVVEKLPNQRIPERHALSVTVPGAVRGWFDLHARYGRLPMAKLLAPAIALAAEGFAVLPITAREWAVFEPVIRLDPACAELYRAGGTPQAGDQFANPLLAAVLRAIATEGPDAFYLGDPARHAAAANQARGGVLSADDFAAHRGDFTVPLERQFRGLKVLECPPNTHGVAVLDALEELDGLALDRNDPTTTLAMVEAVGRAMAQAQKTVADPAGNTVCTVVVDRDGLAVTLMSSVFKRFGSGIAVPGGGFVLQNRGFGFSEPGHINGPGPAKRPYHTVVPGAALKDGHFYAGFGVVGGAMQPQGHVQLLVRLAAWGEDLQSAIDAPRWRLEGAKALAIEPGTPDTIAKALRAAGYTDPVGAGELAGRSDFGGAQFVLRAEDGSLHGGSDKRKDGVALGA
ncbi:gamma-glutamyltransferase family protein [Aminobacter sp. HY435]|uniref:gamma-glutamyltransferase family protein n=1 Tax=Aminobacter sp. HY435 TaxID=2970917 RepID=UPI0022B9CF72|nr:gamma-glutamyltransferase [Aminobacter sp. HY435]